MTESFLHWKWKFRAWDILTVNYELLPTVILLKNNKFNENPTSRQFLRKLSQMIGALATCLIFLVQLRLSEFT